MSKCNTILHPCRIFNRQTIANSLPVLTDSNQRRCIQTETTRPERQHIILIFPITKR